jgi:hypothetical protein
MKHLTFLTAIFVLASPLHAGEPVGPAYAAQKAAELKELQRRNAAKRVDTAPTVRPVEQPTEQPQLTGPAYAAARQRWLRGIQRKNARYWGTAPVGPAYAAATQQVKANQRLWNGTWTNNMYWFSRPTVRIKGPYQSTPAFRGLNDPYVWGSQANSFWRY